MLKLKKLKILSLCPVLLAFVSCGKKVAESKSAEQGQTGINAAPEIALEATMDGATRAQGVFTIPRSGDAYLTSTIQAKLGNAAGYSLKVYMNRTGTTWEFSCQYKGVTNATYNQYTLERCTDMDGLDLGLSPTNITSFSFPLDQGKTIGMSISGSTTGPKTTARAVFRAEWR